MRNRQESNGGKTPKECKNLLTLTLEDPIALYTFVLTLATVLLFVATCGLWYMAVRQGSDTKEAIAAARDSAAAAKLSARSAINAQVPFFVRHKYRTEPFLTGWPTSLDFPNGIKAKLEFLNAGNTFAEKTHECACYMIAERLPETPIYNGEYKCHVKKFVLPNTTTQLQTTIRLTDAEIASITYPGRCCIWIYGYIRYLDYMGTVHEFRFCSPTIPAHPGKTPDPLMFVALPDTPSLYFRRS